MSTRTDRKRAELADGAADYLLAQGVGVASLRNLATALGTSDRMLLHYFATKDELVAAALERVVARLQALLAGPLDQPLPFAVVVQHLAAQARRPELMPYFRIWTQFAAASAPVAPEVMAPLERIAGTTRVWLAAAIDDPEPQRRNELAALAMAIVDGFAVLDALGQHATVDDAVAALGRLSAS